MVAGVEGFLHGQARRKAQFSIEAPISAPIGSLQQYFNGTVEHPGLLQN